MIIKVFGFLNSYIIRIVEGLATVNGIFFLAFCGKGKLKRGIDDNQGLWFF